MDDKMKALKQIVLNEYTHNGRVDYATLHVLTDIPERTFRSWLEGSRKPPEWVLNLLLYVLINKK